MKTDAFSGDATPPHEQVRIAPRSEALSGGQGDLLILPIKGRGYGAVFKLNVDTA